MTIKPALTKADVRAMRPCQEDYKQACQALPDWETTAYTPSEMAAHGVKHSSILWAWVREDVMGRAGFVEFACRCAESALPIFEEARPGDDRPRTAIEAARLCALNTTPENEDAAWAAAWAAAEAAADAAAGAAAWVARAAARAAWASEAAAEAAWAAARAAQAAAWAAARAAAWAAEAAAEAPAEAAAGAAQAAAQAAAWAAAWAAAGAAAGAAGEARQIAILEAIIAEGEE